MRFLIAILGIPLVEIALFVQLGGAVGLILTLLWVVFSVVLGVVIIRQQGINTLRDLQQMGRSEESSPAPLVYAAMSVVAGILLIFPGFLTDALGLALLIPWIRSLVFAHLGQGAIIQRWAWAQSDDDVVEGEYREVPPTPHAQVRDRP